ncbi:MAG: DUF87 domain-containing protein [Robiginitomaculum sp.]
MKSVTAQRPVATHNVATHKPIEHKPTATQIKAVEVGRILSVGSSQVSVNLNKSIISSNRLHLAQIGTVLKIITHNSIVVAMVSSLEIGGLDNEQMHDGCIAKLSIMGEITTNTSTRQTKFFRGVRSFPVLNQPVMTMLQNELNFIFSTGDEPSIEIGKLQQDNNICVRVRTNDLLSKHFAIIGSTGSGKSCTVALVLQAILDESPNAHVVLFDPHNEYSHSFGDLAALTQQTDLDLPIWLFDFEEVCELLTSEIMDQKREEIEVLSEVILKAKQLYDRSLNNNEQIAQQVKLDDIEKNLHRVAAHISLDSPVPYRMRDVLRLIDYYMGLLENTNNLGPYKRLSRRIQMLMADPQYKFVFKNQVTPRSIQDITGGIFRIPVQNKPISILDFSGIPSKTINIVVSVISRLAFELAMWSKRSIPILLVCEEAHRYIPADTSLGFSSTRKSISRIAKEGRKYGVSLGIISQRPSELEPSALSQCGTIFSMRLSNERDQNFVRAAISDGAAELLAFLPSLGTAEMMVFGESVNLPMRVILNTLEAERRPHSSSAEFTDLWSAGEVSPTYMNAVFENWRKRTFDATPELASVPSHKPISTQLSSNFTPSKLRATRKSNVPVIPDLKSANTVDEVKQMLNSVFHRNI